ncbi:LTA synthase family protein [Methylophaga sp.]|uniref:LTA synthase family protein n=1 Tax=Methylophaga sp. TaxID=2024840 RepID=UPI003F6997C5
MSKSIQETLGPYSVIFKLVTLGLIILSAFRLGFTVWQWDRVSDVTTVSDMFVYGVRSDLIITGMLFSPLILLTPLFANRYTWSVWKKIILVWGVICISLLVFMEVATPTFILEYDLRPNRLFIEYLKYPSEVGAMLWNGFRVPLLLGISLTIILTVLSAKILQTWLKDYTPSWSTVRTVLVWPLIVLIFFVMIRSSFSHRPANPALFARTSDALVNSLYINSAWSVYFAIYNLKHEEKSSAMYGELSDQEIVETLSKVSPWLGLDDMSRPTQHYQQASVKRDKPLNLVIVLEESLGAEFVESLGGKALTPHLSALKETGWWFENLYATGTRSVRGIEAVISGFPPTPARSVVKLSLAQNHFFTIADYLRNMGYQTEFVYGGESHFDNMASFLVGNGFDNVIDERDFENPVFMGSWGASDGDLFAKAHERITELNQTDKPFFSFIFSSSNHSPYEYPDGFIKQIDNKKETRDNAVLYSDYALGEFIRKAKQSPYWENTLFLVVADHSSHAGGDNLVPINDFHIPGLILGADIKPEKIQTIASQIDLAPTVLSLMGISGEHPMIGRDLTLPDERQSEGRALMQFSDYFALMQGEKVTVLRPGKTPVSGIYNKKNKSLDITPHVNDDDAKIALANALLPSWLYREQKYH